MNCLDCSASYNSMWPKGTLIKRARVSKEDTDAFIEWQKVRDPVVEWTVVDFTSRNKYFIHNFQRSVRNEWNLVDGEWMFSSNVRGYK